MKETCCYLGDTIGAQGSEIDGVTTMIKNGQNKFRDALSLLASRRLPLGAKGTLYSARVRGVMFY